MKCIALIFLILATPAWGQPYEQIPPEDHSWHLLQKQYDGLIRSVQSGLTKHECEFAKNRVMGLPATPEESKAVRIEQERHLAEAKERQLVWEKSHPQCLDNKRPYDPECTSSNSYMFVPMGNMSISRTTDINSAECFQ